AGGIGAAGKPVFHSTGTVWHLPWRRQLPERLPVHSSRRDRFGAGAFHVGAGADRTGAFGGDRGEEEAGRASFEPADGVKSGRFAGTKECFSRAAHLALAAFLFGREGARERRTWICDVIFVRQLGADIVCRYVQSSKVV